MEFFDLKKFCTELDNIISNTLRNSDLTLLGKLLILQIGSIPESTKYVNLKLSLCNRLGIPAEHVVLDADDSAEAIFSQIQSYCNDPLYTSVIIQLPIIRDDLKDVVDLIPYDKDVDILSSEAKKRFYSGDFTRLSPLVRATSLFIESYLNSVQNPTAVVIGQGSLVGKPITHYLRSKNWQVKVYAENDSVQNLEFDADLVISATGVPSLLKGSNMSKDVSVIDFGSTVIDGAIRGDLDLTSNLDHLAIVSPSPGGLGPIVVRYLIFNHLRI